MAELNVRIQHDQADIQKLKDIVAEYAGLVSSETVAKALFDSGCIDRNEPKAPGELVLQVNYDIEGFRAALAASVTVN